MTTFAKIIKCEDGRHELHYSFQGFYPSHIPEEERNLYAYIPEDVLPTLENFPYGDLTTEEIDGVVTIKDWIAGEIPPPPPPPPYVPTEEDLMAEQWAADLEELCLYQLGILP